MNEQGFALMTSATLLACEAGNKVPSRTRMVDARKGAESRPRGHESCYVSMCELEEYKVQSFKILIIS